MADDIYGNMSNMSVDELGSSLLQKKAESDRAAAKKAKKNERIQQGLALLLMGQGVMKTQFKKRMKELDDFHKFETIGNDNKAKQLNMNSTILNTIGNTWNGKNGLEGFKNSDDYLRFSQEVRPFVDQKIKAMTADEYDTVYGTSTYENAMDLASESYAKKYLEIDKKSGKANYLAYQDGLREILGDEAIDMDKNELFQRAMGLSADELTIYQRRNYQKVLAEYKAQGNIVGGFKRVLGLFNDDYKRKGGFDIFSKVTEDALAGPTIRDLNQAMNLKGMTNNIVSKALADASKSPTRWKERASGKRFENYRKNVGELYLPQMTELIEEGRYPSELQTSTFIGKNNWEEFMDDMSPLDKEALILDTTALSLRLKEDRKFLTAVYNETEGKKEDGKSFNEFKAILDDEANRTMFAANIVTDAGFRDENWNPFNWKQETYNSFGTLTKVYNKYNASTLLGDDIKVNDRGGLDLPESYIDASVDRKKDMLESTVKDILTNSKTENERNIKLGGALDIEINKYFGMDSQAYIESLAAKEMKASTQKPSQEDLKKVGFGNMFGDNLDFQNPVMVKSEINRLNKILDTGNLSTNQEKTITEKVNILERSVSYLENKPKLDPTTRLFGREDKEIISDLKQQLIDEKDDLRPSQVKEIQDRINRLENPDEKKKTELSSNYENPEYNKLLDLHLDRLGIDGKEIATQKLNELSSFILEVESDGDFNAANPNSSARGGYQFIKGSVIPAVNRLEKYLGPLPRFDEVRKTGDVRSLSPEDQTLLFMADILEKKGSDKLINNFLNADNKKDKQNAAYEIYTVLHHTTDKKGKIPFRAKLQTKFKLRKYFDE
tara:strand:+ start:4159 stop:6672 length:2514 start_codon:yes stop_codon:yes gene_type:complete